MDTIMLENYIGLAIILLIMAKSKKILLTAVIAFYYVAYIFIDSLAVDGLVTDAPFWYLLNALLDLSVMATCTYLAMNRMSYLRTTIIYILYVGLFHLIPDLIQANLIKTELRYVSIAGYQYIMNYAIQFDILVAIIGSDNLISRRIFVRSLNV